MIQSPQEGRALAQPQNRAVALATMIEAEAVSHLRARGERTVRGAAALPVADEAALAAFARTVLVEDGAAIERRVQAMVRAGAALPRVFLEWLAPTANLLGRWWEEDRVSFADVTFALGKLHQVVHASAARALDRAPISPPVGSAYFATLPGEAHRFGLAMVEEMFRLAGWRTWTDSELDAAVAARTVGEQFFDVIGISLSDRRQLTALATLIRAIRAASANPQPLVLVGGPVFSEDPASVAAVGADGTAVTAQQALDLAEQKRHFSACANTPSGSI
jgi:methanogenic corrinoid protein MtbC1